MADEQEFECILNFRDVGATINSFVGKKFVREGLLFRSARPDDATSEDRRRLTQDYGMKTVMDLRTKTEHANQAKKRQADLKLPVLLETNEALSLPVRIEGLRYLEIIVTGRSFNWYLVRQLPWPCIFKFIFFLLIGYRMHAIRILGENVMKPRGLIGLARDTLDHCQPEINQALSAFLEPNILPVLVHCTQGKDRTGLIIMLVLMILGAPPAAISHDYRLTDEALTRDKEQHEQRLREIRELGLPDEFGDTAPAMVPQMEKYLISKYGGLDGYLDLIGFGEESRGKLRQLLLY